MYSGPYLPDDPNNVEIATALHLAASGKGIAVEAGRAVVQFAFENFKRAKALIQSRIWWLYNDIKAWCLDPMPPKSQGTGQAVRPDRRHEDQVRNPRPSTRAHSDRPPKLPENPPAPGHSAPHQRLGDDIRSVVTRRKIRGGTRPQAPHRRRYRWAAVDVNLTPADISDSAGVQAVLEGIRKRCPG
ncbi:hypothetical protein C8D77_1405 [Mesorhizobium loti]|uniref:Uncharacterized protein n=1 Tax=Rhizobium loti TaxID=381 RepID=A0A8E3B192_RHILI|nr:hypothetical protein C8D77_1405 [Mesorhizobium loti]